MYLLIGAGDPLARLAAWCKRSRPTCVVTLATSLQAGDELDGCDVVALPAPMPVDALPTPSRHPSLIVVLDAAPIEAEHVIEALNSRWPSVPIIGPDAEGEATVATPLRPEDLLLSAAKDRVRAQERHTGASVLDAHFASLAEGSSVAIFCHDNPDPDALASALAVQRLVERRGLTGRIYHGGLIEHHQNRAMVHLLGIETTRLIMGWEIADVLAEADAVVAVDFHQPGANNVLPKDHVPNIILDHHAVGDLPAADVAIVHPEFSATSSLVASLMTALDAEMDSVLATALAFGIRTDTLGFSRGVSPSDLRALSWLNAWVDHDLLRQIEAPPRSKDALAAFAEALASMTLEGGVLLAPLHHLPNRDALSQVADFLLATEGVDTVAVYGPRQGRVILSARTRNPDLHLGHTLAGQFPDGQAGGHRSLAGGQVHFGGLVEGENPEVDAVIAAMTDVLRTLFGGDGDE